MNKKSIFTSISYEAIFKKSVKILKYILIIELLKGLFVALRYFFKKKVTLAYPYEKAPISPLYRGELALQRDEEGKDLCIGCKLCEAICPAQAITIESYFNIEDNQRRASLFNLDMTKCIYCGLCEEACPVDAIVQTPSFEYASYTREELYANKDKLLATGDQFKPLLKIKCSS